MREAAAVRDELIGAFALTSTRPWLPARVRKFRLHDRPFARGCDPGEGQIVRTKKNGGTGDHPIDVITVIAFSTDVT
jgi:hypothetical protein